MLQAIGLSLQGAQAHAQLAHPAQAANQEGPAAYPAFGATPGHSVHVVQRLQSQAALFGGVHHSARQRVFAAALQAGRRAQLRRLLCVILRRIVRITGQHKSHQPRLADGQRTGLVKGHGVGAVRQLQRLRVLDQNAFLGRHAGAGHDGRRRRQAQRAGAGDHQHRHRADQRYFERLAHGQPAQQRGQRDQQHHRHEHRSHLVHQTLDRRLAGLRVFHQADDSGQHGVAPDGAHAHQHTAVAIDAAAGQGGIGFLGDRQRLAGEHRLVHLRATFQQDAVHRHALARQHHQAVAQQQLAHRHVNLLAVFQHHMRQRRPQRMQGADGGGGLAFSAGLQPFAQHHQRDHHGRGFKVQVRHAAGLSAQPEPHRQPPARAGADGDQQIHVAGARLQRMPAGPVKARAQPELHRRGQRKLPGSREHPVPPGQVGQHGQDQRRSQGQRQRHRGKAGPG